MFGKLKDDVEAPKQVCIGHLCEECISKLKEENKKVFMEISDCGFTGRFCILPECAINPEVLKDLDGVITYLSEEAFSALEQNIKEIEEYVKNTGD